MAITNAQQYKQLVNKPANGKRPGYRGVGEYQSGRSKAGTKGSQFEKGPNVGRDPKESPPVDKSSDLQTYNQNVSRGTQLPPQLQGPIPLNRRELLSKKFIDERPKSKLSLGLFDILSGGKLGQAGMDFLASKNRPFFMNTVVRGGRFQLPGKLGEKYGKLDMFDLNKMTEEELEQAYKAYDRARLGGEIRAIGDKKPGFGKDQGDYSDSVLPIEGIFAAKPKDEEVIEETFTPNFRLMADGGRASFQGGGRDAFKSDFKSPTTTAKAPPSMGFGNPPPGSTGEGGGNNEPPIKLPKPLKRAVDTIGEGMFLKNLINLNPYGIMKNVGSKILLDKLISEADTQQDQNMLKADVSQADIDAKKEIRGFQDMDYDTYKSIMEFKGGTNVSPFEFKGLQEGTITEPGRYTAADGGIMSPEGGIMDLESGRQMYFLGKLVKKATRAVKKIVKSPIGKAALFAGLGAYAGGLGPFGKIAGSGFLKSGSPLMSTLFKKGTIGSGLTGKGMLALGGGLTLAPFLMGDQDDDNKEQVYKGADLPFPVDYYLSGQYGMNRRLVADGGIMRANYQEGGDAEPVAKKTMPLLDMDGKEKDYRETGGFVDMGRMERADDVPARLSKNEFVFTADAVRNAGEGDIDKGAEVMYNMMKNLEAGGEVSEESQGLEGAREMFQTSQRLEEVL